MTALFAGTFYWIVLANPGDAAHDLAGQVTDDIVTTEEVLTEYLTFLGTRPNMCGGK